MKKKQKVKKEKQLNLGLKESPGNFFLKIKGRITKTFIRFEIKEFLKSPLTWLTVIISLCLIGTQIYTLVNNFDFYPSEIPIWKNQTSSALKLAEKDIIIIFPSFSAFLLILGTTLSNIFYHREKFLSKVLLYSTLMSILSLTISFIKLTP
jgi:hypothetical protein